MSGVLLFWVVLIYTCLFSEFVFYRGTSKRKMAVVPASKGTGLAIAFIFGVCSASMAFANKAVLSSYSYNFPITLVTLQMLFTIILLEILRLMGLITLPAFSLERGMSFLIPSIFYAVNCVLALSALSGMNIPMYGLIKRCSPLVILILGAMMLGKGLPSRPICISVGMVTVGCIVAGECYSLPGILCILHLLKPLLAV